MYSLPYLLLLFFFAAAAYLFEKTDSDEAKRKINISVVSVFFIFFAFRGYLYTDWQSYATYMEKVEWDELFDWDPLDSSTYEPGFAFLTLLCKSVYNDYAFLVFVCMAIDTMLFLRFLKHRKIDNYALAFMLFISFEGLAIMFNLIRNAISIFILINAMEYIEKRKPLQYFSLCILALMFHASSLVFLPLYFFLHKRFNKWIFLAIAVLCVMFFFSKISFVSLAVKILGIEGTAGGKVEAYTEYMTSTRVFAITHFLENYILVALVFLYYDDILEKFPNHIVIVNSLLIFLIMYFVFAEFRTLSTRLSIIFIFSYWLLWIDVFKVLQLPNNKIMTFSLLFLYGAYMLVKNITMPCQEYDNILFGAKSQQERMIILNRTYQEDD